MVAQGGLVVYGGAQWKTGGRKGGLLQSVSDAPRTPGFQAKHPTGQWCGVGAGGARVEEFGGTTSRRREGKSCS